MTLTIPLAILGNDDGLVDAQLIVGTFLEPTDCAPEGTPLTSAPFVAVPAVSGWASVLLGALLLGAGGLALRKRTVVAA